MGVATYTAPNHFGIGVLVAILWCCGTFGISAAKPTPTSGTPVVDWRRGLLITRSAALGDIRSPTRPLARVKAERIAKQRGRAKLIAAVAKLPLVNTAKPKRIAKLHKSRLAASIFVLDMDTGSEGSVVVEMALPLDAVRGLLFGADTLVQSEVMAASKYSAILVDARDLRMRPALGFQIGDTETRYRGPVVFYQSEAIARANPRVGEHAPLFTATKREADTLVLPGTQLGELTPSRPLVVILWNGDNK